MGESPVSAVPTWREALRRVVPAFLVSRALLVAVGVAALRWWGVAADASANYQARSSAIPAVEMWLRFDASWYLAIATAGYTGAIPSSYDMRPGFFPMYPWLVAAVSATTGHVVASALLVSAVLCVVFLAAVWLLAAGDFGPRVASRAVWAIALFPSTYFIAAIYSEPAMLAFVAVSLVAARGGAWVLLPIATAAATLSRTIGFLVLLPVAWELWRHPARIRTRLLAFVAATAAAGAAFGLYLWLAQGWFGNPFHFVELQQWYRGETAWPWRAFDAWLEAPAWHGYANSTLDAVVAVGWLALAGLTAWKWNPALGAYCLAAVLIPLGTGLVSTTRLVLAAFPCFVTLSLLLERRGARVAWFLVSLALLVVLTARVATWRWVA